MVHVSGRSSTSGPSIQRIVNLEEGVGNDAAWHRIFFFKLRTQRVSYHGSADQVIRNVKYWYDLALLAKVETVVEGMTESLTKIWRRHGLEMIVEKKN